MIRQRGAGLAIIAALGLIACSASAGAQNAPTPPNGEESQDKPTGTTGSVLFEALPDDIGNPGGASYNWRFRRAPNQGTLPLDEFRVVLMANAGTEIPAKERVVRLSGYGAAPATLAVGTGSAVQFVSEGPIAYQLEVVGRSMEPVKLEGPGSTQTVTLEKVGRYVFQDPVSTSVTAFVIVGAVIADSGLSQVSGREASFDFGRVPPGQYRMRVYFRGNNLASLEREVSVAANGVLAPSKTLLGPKDITGSSN